MPLQQTSGNDTADAYGGGAAAKVKYIEDFFVTWLRTGTGASATVTTGLDASANKALVWTKSRSAATDHKLTDTVRGATKALISDTAGAQTTDTNGLTAFSSTGYTIGTDTNYNNSGATYVDWEFVAAPKFFDVVTYTGTGSAHTIAHSLGSTPGCIIVKRTDLGLNWQVYHSSLANTDFLILNTNDPSQTNANLWNSTTPTSASFTVGTSGNVNASGGTYVAYLFASNAGGFGLTGTDNVITCGSFTSDGSGFFTATLGYEPQWVMYKQTNTTDDWKMIDIMRGMTNPYTNGARLLANSSAAEGTGNGFIQPTATGFYGPGTGAASGTYIYIAIRRGPMKVPTDATKVFTPALRTGTNGNTTTTTAGFPVDLFFTLGKNGSSNYPQSFDDRLRGTTTLYAYSTQAESTSGSTDFLNFATESGVNLTYNVADLNNSPGSYTDNYFVRAPSFFDEVCYTGTGSNTTQTHNLGAIPELIIVKERDATGAWQIYSKALANTEYLVLNTNAAKATGATRWNSTTPTSTVFSIGTDATVNTSAGTYAAYLFATCAGVSKVGSYTGNGTGQSISCGFGASGARFILIKRTDSTGNWYYFNSADGLTSSSSPYILVNQQVAYTTGNNGVYASAGGFTLGATAITTTNIATASYIFLAIA